LLHRLFSVRSLGLFGELAPGALASYLSGLLIGAELRDATAGARAAVAVIGSPHMTALYVEALKAIGVAAEALDGDPLLRAALHAVAETAHLI